MTREDDRHESASPGDGGVRVAGREEVGQASGEMLGVLVKLADRRFGPDARRLELVADARGLTVRGDAEAVRWARDLVKRMSDR